MTLWLYRGLIRLLGPVLLLTTLWRYRQYGNQRQAIAERLGWVNAPAASVIWVHAASVGEVRAVAAVVQQALDAGHAVHLTTNTPTGRQAAWERFGDTLTQSYPPLDTPAAVKRFLNRLQPRAAIRVELELWPTLLIALQQRGIKTALINARLSERSLQRYQRVRGLMPRVLAVFDWVGVQSQTDAQRLQALGLAATRIDVTGNLKFDQVLDSAQVAAGRHWRTTHAAKRPVWVAASVRDGEGAIMVEAHQRLRERYPEALLLLVPRHPASFQLPPLPDAWGSNGCAQHSKSERVDADTAMVLGDTMGELTMFLAAADIAFVGGSLVPVGGHNPLEPAVLGLPIIMGPHVFNFAGVDALLAAAGGRYRVANSADLAATLESLFDDAAMRERAGSQALSVVNQHRGAAQRTWQQLTQHLELTALE